MKPLIDRIREAGEFDGKSAESICEIPLVRKSSMFKIAVESMRYQHAQNKWAFEALDKAVAHIEQTEWLEYHACATGDCEHKTQYECFIAIMDEFKHQARVSIEVRAEIAALVPKGE